MGLNNKHTLQSGTIVLVTGAAGFIGFHASQALLERGCIVIGYDNCNDYYDVSLKNDRLKILSTYPDFTFIKGDLADKEALDDVFTTYAPTLVLHLGAQAGVRYSIDNPYAYMQSNLVGFLNILEACRNFKIEHLVYASSSSVYGMNEKVPFSTSDNVDSPVSLYAATKKSNELMAHCYTHLYGFPSTGLRFFTVYGPWGRPDMAYFSFTNSIMKGKPIKIFNNGDMCGEISPISMM
jgi:UDP-glucuronate 4-epimerase